jgi:superfamily II DNA or RNA helicase
VLQRISVCLTEEGLVPPGRWGTSEARSFVASLGFPEEFAASAGSKRDAELLVSGPIHLPPLHDFQEEVVDGLRELVESGEGRRRTVVCLPTGGGKTRATVQAAVELILVPAKGRRSVLWIAQTDELCEQAVQAFRQVWANVGARSTDLRVVRLWGGHRNPARSEEGQPVAVIASIQTLTSRVGQEDLAWLSEPGLVVIDECHHAITKSYTGVLRWLDAETPRGGVMPEKEPPVIGLSATPFRSSQDPEESQRLAKRFDCRWLPANQEDLYRKLLDRGILAHADHVALESDSQIPADLLSALENLDFDSIQADNIMEEINRRLAADEARNELLIDTISASGASSILCFANSVDHAEEITARLCVRGIAAAAVSGETPRSARRYFLSRFQSGEIRVLCNYLVLSTGFDAPKTDMLLISRQVMSPVRYMQMVGRGLRGPANGGTERCKIFTVMDNLGRFSRRHPYHYCSQFFSEGGIQVPSANELSPSERP